MSLPTLHRTGCSLGLMHLQDGNRGADIAHNRNRVRDNDIDLEPHEFRGSQTVAASLCASDIRTRSCGHRFSRIPATAAQSGDPSVVESQHDPGKQPDDREPRSLLGTGPLALALIAVFPQSTRERNQIGDAGCE